MIRKQTLTRHAAANGDASRSWVRGVSHAHSNVDEKALGVFQPDILISTQYLATYRRRFQLSPEQALMLAVMQDAILCFQDYATSTCKRKRLLHDDAEQWIVDEQSSYLFSFENICDALGFEASYLRQGLIRWKQRAREKSPRRDQRKKAAG